ncbi:PEP-CTERM protein-sorting domain-containing protein [Nitrosospira sp. Nsp14]|uniref:HAF repeat-containing PEP-CTERM protein n=1 Tax=Nitrosospira sp. Nsp14 TaxID=1855333 RepID=UPI0008ED3B10|nr:HAF repeat-containing PEP-CTERM protein [Nitrosospira sp. Nsp14]SFH58281.1 PEP-CTERM protein-sorting domain-containing protein [Nitrosospira sp. Nsp14]
MQNHCLTVRNLILAIALITGFGLVTHANAQMERSFFVDLNAKTATPVGTADSLALGINDAGQVVGTTYPSNGNLRAFIAGPNGMDMRDLGTLGGDLGSAFDINDAGQVAGWSTAETSQYAFITGPDGIGMRNLGTLGGSWSNAYGINDRGQVVGESLTDGDNLSRAFITGPDGMGMRNLGSLGGSSSAAWSSARGINNVGQVTGFSTTGEESDLPPRRAFITGPDGAGMRDLGTLGGYHSYAEDINDPGQVAGWSYTAEGFTHAFITGPDGVGVKDLGTLGGNESYARGINDTGQVVGESDTGEYSSLYNHAFITGPNGEGMMDLNLLVDLPPGWILTDAIDINNNGQVIALGVPEPETYALMLTGLGLIGFMARRRKADNLG